MMNCHANSNVLPLDLAKRLWTLMKNPFQNSVFVEAGEEGGVDVEIKKPSFSKESLSSLVLPDKCYDLYIEGQLLRGDIPCGPLSEYMIGGLGRQLPSYGWMNAIWCIGVPKDFRHPIGLSYEIGNTLKWFGRSFDVCHEVSLGHLPSYMSLFGEFSSYAEPEESDLRSWLATVWKEKGLPVEASKGYLEGQFSAGMWSCCFDPLTSDWTWEKYEQLVRDLFKDSPKIRIISIANPGFINSPDTLKSDALALVKETLSAPFEEFDVRYNAVVAMSWRDREKIRKKWKQPVLQELGRIEYSNGTQLEIKLVIHRDGYEFMVETDDTDAVNKFQKSKISKAVEWSWDA